MPIVGTKDKVWDKSNPEYYEPMPIRATSKPLTSYVNGKPFKDAPVKKCAPKEERDAASAEQTVEVPHDKEPLDWRDPEATKVYEDVSKRSKMNAMEKRLKKKEEKVQKDWEEKQAELRGSLKSNQVEEKAEDKKKDKYAFEKVQSSKDAKSLKKSGKKEEAAAKAAAKEGAKETGKESGKEVSKESKEGKDSKEAQKDAAKDVPCCDDKAGGECKGDQKTEKKEAAAPAKK